MDVVLSMGLLDKINPFKGAIDNVTATIDSYVDQATLDKDLAAKLKSEIALAQIEVSRFAMEAETALIDQRERSYQIELQTKTLPRVDAMHKMARTILAALSMVITPGAVIWLSAMGIEITTEIVATLSSGNLAAGIYTYRKGKGYPYQPGQE